LTLLGRWANKALAFWVVLFLIFFFWWVVGVVTVAFFPFFSFPFSLMNRLID
jgi:hypothetical protein